LRTSGTLSAESGLASRQEARLETKP
jgi:hypothetical protein